jgi:hypothetical protein
MSGSQYYKILGLEPTSTYAEVKRRFRALAKQYHPDRNPNQDATEIFQRLLEAYERILKKDFNEARPVQSTHRGKSQQEQHREFHRKAWERYEQMRREQEAYSKEVYISHIRGYRMQFKRIIALCCFILLCVLVADQILPLKSVNDQVVNYNSTSYQSFTEGYVHEITTKYGHHFFVANYDPRGFNKYPTITYLQTAISRSDVSVIHQGKPIEVHFTYYWARGFLFVIFSLGLLIPFYKKDTILLYLSTYASLYLVSGIILSYLLLNYRILSIITLGNWP